MQDKKYAEFMCKLIPTVPAERIIGVRTPALRTYAKEFAKQATPSQMQSFLSALPHSYFEENQLHGFIMSGIKDFDECIRYLTAFLPYIDNWATCDQTSPRVLKKYKQELLPLIDEWLTSGHVYTIRFAIGMLMQHFLDEDFNPEYMHKVCAVTNDDYYVKMEVAWYFATALAKQWEAALPILQKSVLPEWTHNKTIQKAVESYRITAEQKQYLRTLRR
ncbi:MAG: DNA alkylation repair protein [Treponema sp.]|nr:DNA alkylation repair protein [Treponema sp.]